MICMFIVHLSDKSKIVSYADDTVIIHSALPSDEGLTELKAIVEGDLVNLATWFKNNGLKANPSKTEMSLFGTSSVIKKSVAFRVSFWRCLIDTRRTYSFFGSFSRSDSVYGKTNSGSCSTMLWNSCHAKKVELHSSKIYTKNTCTNACLPSSDVLLTSLGTSHGIDVPSG